MAEERTITPAFIRKARAYLQSRGLRSSDIPPKEFALTAKRLGKTFGELLKTIAQYQMGGQGVGQSPKADKFISDKQKDTKL